MSTKVSTTPMLFLATAGNGIMAVEVLLVLRGSNIIERRRARATYYVF